MLSKKGSWTTQHCQCSYQTKDKEKAESRVQRKDNTIKTITAKSH